VELYDHQSDPDENENVAAQHPELVEELLSKLRKLQQGEQEERQGAK